MVAAAWWTAQETLDSSLGPDEAGDEATDGADAADSARTDGTAHPRGAAGGGSKQRARAKKPGEVPEVPPPSPADVLWADATAKGAADQPLEALEIVAAARKGDEPVWKDAARVATMLKWEDTAIDRFAAAAQEKDAERKAILAWLKRLDAAVLDPARRKRLDLIRRALAEAGKFDVAAVVDAAQAEGRAALEKHLARFGGQGGKEPPPAAQGAAGAAAPAGLGPTLDGNLVQLRTRNAARARAKAASGSDGATDPAESAKGPPPVADPLATDEAALREQRRIEQLEKLRQRASEGLLEPIAAGLAWLALHQADDGEISDRVVAARCEAIAHKPGCLQDEKQAGQKYRLSGTALSVLALLDFRDQDVAGLFEPTLAQGVQWLRRQMREDGSFGTSGYEAAMALMALGQAAQSSHAPELLADVSRGLAFQASKQSLDGGYRYGWGTDGDLSVTGWYVQAFEAGRNAGATLPWNHGTAMERFVRSMWMGGNKFRYEGRSGGERGALSSVGILSFLVLNPESVANEREGWIAGLTASARRADLYAVYYDVRVELALRGELTEQRRAVLADLPRGMQRKALPTAGMFASARVEPVKGKDPTAVWRSLGWLDNGGRVVSTAFSVLTLEHALYRR